MCGMGRGRDFGFGRSGCFADIGTGSVFPSLARRVSLGGGVVAEGGVGDGDAGVVEVLGDLGEGVALVAESGDFGFENLDGLADGVRGGSRRR